MVGHRFAVIPAAYLYLLREDEVLLQRRSGTGYMDGYWGAGAAGHIELHETAAACAVREAVEELGVVVNEHDLQPITVMQRTDGTANPVEQRVDWFLTAERWRGEPRIMEPTKCDALTWHPLDALPASIPDYERIVLDAIRSGVRSTLTTHGFGRAEVAARLPPP